MWRACDGSASIADIALTSSIASAQVEMIVAQVEATGLMEGIAAIPTPSRSRRSLVRVSTELVRSKSSLTGRRIEHTLGVAKRDTVTGDPTPPEGPELSQGSPNVRTNSSPSD